ncbi:hypothetical protein A2U01_0024564, partial [Trifolium medium]|nr:hypothetical protein [Trifolium medium]
PDISDAAAGTPAKRSCIAASVRTPEVAAIEEW